MVRFPSGNSVFEQNDQICPLMLVVARPCKLIFWFTNNVAQDLLSTRELTRLVASWSEARINIPSGVLTISLYLEFP